MRREVSLTRLKRDDLIKNCMVLASDLVKLSLEHMRIDCDRETDILYLSFRKPQRAKKTIETDDDILIRKDGNKIVGIIILNASAR